MKNLSLRVKLLILFIILSLIPLGLAGRTMIRMTRDELKSAANSELTWVTRQFAVSIEEFYHDTWLRPLALIRNGVDNEALSFSEKIALIDAGVSEIKDVVAIQLTVAGFPTPAIKTNQRFLEQLLSAGINPQEILVVDPISLLEKYRDEDPNFGGIEYIPELDTWLLSIILPLAQPISGHQAFLSARVDLGGFRERILENSFQKTGNLYIITAEGENIIHPGEIIGEEVAIVSAAKAMIQSGIRTTKSEPYMAPDGEQMLGAFSTINTFHWAVIAEKRARDAYATVASMSRSLVLWLTIGLLISVTGAVIFAYSVTRPLLKLTGAAENLAETSDFSIRVDVGERSDEIGKLSGTFNFMVEKLNQYIHDLTETTKAKERAESELKLARQIQQSFLPSTFPVLDDIEFFGMCEPAREVGGDYFDYFQIDDDHYGFVIGDVSGKGVPAALFMAVSRTLFRMLSAQGKSPDQVVAEFNNKLVTMDQSASLFITLFYAVLDRRTGEVVYSSAGHCLPLVKSKTLKFDPVPEMMTMVAGIMEDIPVEQGRITLEDGDIFVLYTDGMTEAQDPENEEYGEDRLQVLLSKYEDLSMEEFTRKSIDEVKEFQQGNQFDDMTFLALRIKKVGAA